MKQIKLNDTANGKLNDIKEKRTDDHDPVRTKVGIVEELINAAHKKEVGK